MRTSFGLIALATVLVPAAASATPITVGQSGSLIIDVEFWGRRQIISADPDNPGVDIVTYGAPVQGTFTISGADVPARTHPTSAFPTNPNAVRYAGHPGQEFVTSDWVVPAAPGLASNDAVIIGDHLPFYPNLPRRDWFEVSNAFTDVFPDGNDVRELFVSVTTPLDIIQGTGLDQEFDLVDPVENGGSGSGFFRTKIDGVVNFMGFIVDRLRVSNNGVCRSPPQAGG
jgi:hypothetical protein